MKTNIKNIFKGIFLAGAFVASTTSCSFLDETSPYDNQEVLNESAEGRKALIDAIYANTSKNGGYTQAYPVTRLLHSGLFTSTSANVRANAGVLKPLPNEQWLDNSWLTSYQNINYTNNILDDLYPHSSESRIFEEVEFDTAVIDNESSVQLQEIKSLMSDAGLSQNEKDVIGSALFFRAMEYFNLVRTFGEVPLRTEPTNTENIHMAKASKTDIYLQILSDAHLAEQLLSVESFGNGYAGKYAASMLLSKVYMQLASVAYAPTDEYLVVDEITSLDNTMLWEQAKKYAQAIENSGQYALEEHYAHLYNGSPEQTVNNNPVPFSGENNENSKEAIFGIRYNKTVNQVSYQVQFTRNNYTIGLNHYGRLVPNAETAYLHYHYYGLGSRTAIPNDTRIPATYIETTDQYARDAATGEVKIQMREYEGVLTPSGWNFVARGGNFDGRSFETNISRLYPLLRKLSKKDRTSVSQGDNQMFMVYRYADVLIMLAEINHMLGDDAAMKSYLKQVHVRAFGDLYEEEDGMQRAQNAFTSYDERLYYERQFELLGEGEDAYEVRRRGYQWFMDHVVNYHNSTFIGRNDYDTQFLTDRETIMYLPIPLNEQNKNQKL